MKKVKVFDAVKMMRVIRNRMSAEMKGMTPKEQIGYIVEKSRTHRERERPAGTASKKT